MYFHGGTFYIENRNLDANQTDQRAYMTQTKTIYDRIHGTNYFLDDENKLQMPYTHDGARGAFYPFLQILSYDPQQSDIKFFTKGKYLNLYLSLIFLGIIAAVLWKDLGMLAALTITLITAFTIFMPRAGAFQVELTYYTLFFLCFVSMWHMLKQPTWHLAITTGILLGIGQYTKYAFLPALLLFITIYSAKLLYHFYKNNHRNPRSSVGKLILTVVVFFIIMSPQLLENKNKFGMYFYNVNSVFYVWYDSWSEIEQGTRAHNDRIGWPTMSDEEIPTFSKYIKRHDGYQILYQRPLKGLKAIWKLSLDSYGWQYYLLAFLLIIPVLMLRYHRISTRDLAMDWSIVIFIILFFSGYLFLTAWWVAAQSYGMRFILFLQLPLFYTLAQINQVYDSIQMRIFYRQIYIRELFYMGLLLIIPCHAFYLSTAKIAEINGLL